MLHERGGARAVRYINTNEADGSISVAIDPAVIATVATIEIPFESVAVETSAAAAAATKAVTALAEIVHLRPDTTGIDELSLRFPTALERKFPDPADPERQRIEAIAEQLNTYHTQRQQIWALLTSTLESEYLREVNDQVHRRFHDVLAHTDDPAQYHQSIRLLGALLARLHDVIAELAHAPIRTMNNAGSQ
jgi:hypothetical protein